MPGGHPCLPAGRQALCDFITIDKKTSLLDNSEFDDYLKGYNLSKREGYVYESSTAS